MHKQTATCRKVYSNRILTTEKQASKGYNENPNHLNLGAMYIIPDKENILITNYHLLMTKSENCNDNIFLKLNLDMSSTSMLCTKTIINKSNNGNQR